MLAGAGQQRDPVGEGRVGDVSVGFVENEPLLDGPQALVGNIPADVGENHLDDGRHKLRLSVQVAQVEVAVADADWRNKESESYLTFVPAPNPATLFFARPLRHSPDYGSHRQGLLHQFGLGISARIRIGPERRGHSNASTATFLKDRNPGDTTKRAKTFAALPGLFAEGACSGLDSVEPEGHLL